MSGLFSEGEQSGTLGSNLLLADTGNMAYGLQPITVLASAGTAAKCRLEHRNAANTETLWSQVFWVGAAQAPTCFTLPKIIEENESVRVMLVNGILGNIQATIAIP